MPPTVGQILNSQVQKMYEGHKQRSRIIEDAHNLVTDEVRAEIANIVDDKVRFYDLLNERDGNLE